jgi:hypothetical protein
MPRSARMPDARHAGGCAGSKQSRVPPRLGRDLPAAGVSDYQFEARQRSQIPPKFPLWGASAPMEEGQMCRRDARGSRSAGAGC